MNFTAIDFETAQGAGHSICQIGLVQVENGEIVSTMNQLIQPPGNYYSYYNIKVHGITPDMTRDSPTFDDVWGAAEALYTGSKGGRTQCFVRRLVPETYACILRFGGAAFRTRVYLSDF